MRMCANCGRSRRAHWDRGGSWTGDCREYVPAMPTLPAEQFWDVFRMDPVFGVGTERIDRFQAKTRVDADRIAIEKHGTRILVTLASNAKRIEPRRRAKDLGNMKLNRRTQR